MSEKPCVQITHLSHEGRGIAELNGKKLFIHGALPTEIVSFDYVRRHRHFDEGKMTAIIQASPERIKPHCSHFGICGGCNLQHLSETFQIKHKQTVLLEHLTHQANCEPKTILDPIHGESWHYRRKARLSVKFVEKKNKVLVGFREINGRFVADISRCEILHNSIGSKIYLLSELLNSFDGKRDIPQIEIAIGDTITALIFRHMRPLSQHDYNQLIQFSKTHNYHLYLQPRDESSIHLVFPATSSKNDNFLFYALKPYQLTLYFHPAQFTQINTSINVQMIARAIELLTLKKTDRVLDLFCGIGNFSLPIAKFCQQVTGVEGSVTAIQQAQQNALYNNISNARFFQHDLTASLDHLTWSKDRYDKILLDPPRTGAKELLPHIACWEPERIVYISCNPITLARDAKCLLDLGYVLEKAGVMDMFPHTQHVEAIALFSRKNHDHSKNQSRSLSLDTAD